MTYSYTIPLETPAKKNSRITLKNGMTIPSKKYREWHKNASLHIITQKRPSGPLSSSLKISFTFVHGDFHRRDSDNQVSSILDLLQDAKIIIDDSWQFVRIIEVQNEYSKNNAKCIVTVTELDN